MRQRTIGEIVTRHCGHPTALWPWELWVRDRLILQPNGTAWQLKREAETAGGLILQGKLRTYVNRRGYTCCGDSNEHIREAWELIWSVCPRKNRSS